MDVDGTISTEVAIIHNKQGYYNIVTMGLPLDNDSRAVPSQVTAACGLVPKGAKKCRSRQKLPEIPDPAAGSWNLP